MLGTPAHNSKPETTAFGWMWMMQNGLYEMDQNLKIRQRTLLLLVPENRVEKVKKHFTDPLTHGLSRIELYTQKCAHLSRQYESIRLQLNQAIISLQQEMITHLEFLDFRQIYREPEQLEQISQHLMHFLAQKATVEILRNSLKNNKTALQENLSRVKLDSPLYTLEREKIIRQIEQIESDLRNAQVVQDSTYALQDIQRAAEGSRFEHASYIMGATAALLAGIALFNGFLEIWSLALENTGWQMPPSGLRIGLSLIASIAIPLATTWGISRKKVSALLAILISIAAIAMMVVSTIWMNK